MSAAVHVRYRDQFDDTSSDIHALTMPDDAFTDSEPQKFFCEVQGHCSSRQNNIRICFYDSADIFHSVRRTVIQHKHIHAVSESAWHIRCIKHDGSVISLYSVYISACSAVPAACYSRRGNPGFKLHRCFFCHSFLRLLFYLNSV